MVGPAYLEQRQLLAAPGVKLDGRLELGRDTGKHYTTRPARHLDRLTRRGALGRAIERQIDAPAGCIGEHLARRVDGPGIERHIGSQQTRQLPPRLHRLDRPHAPGAGELEGGDGEQSDRTGSEYDGRFTELRLSDRDRVQRDRQRLDQTALGDAEVRGQGEEIGSRQILERDFFPL